MAKARKHPDSEKSEGGMKDNEAGEMGSMMRVGAPRTAGRKSTRAKGRSAGRKSAKRR